MEFIIAFMFVIYMYVYEFEMWPYFIIIVPLKVYIYKQLILNSQVISGLQSIEWDHEFIFPTVENKHQMN